MNGNRPAHDRRQADFEIQELRREIEEVRDSLIAFRAELQAMLIDYNTGVGVLKWVKWLVAIGGGFAAGVTALKGWK